MKFSKLLDEYQLSEWRGSSPQVAMAVNIEDVLLLMVGWNKQKTTVWMYEPVLNNIENSDNDKLPIN